METVSHAVTVLTVVVSEYEAEVVVERKDVVAEASGTPWSLVYGGRQGSLHVERCAPRPQTEDAPSSSFEVELAQTADDRLMICVSRSCTDRLVLISDSGRD